jgi:apolipoprotein D and lipocalin family protein
MLFDSDDKAGAGSRKKRSRSVRWSLYRAGAFSAVLILGGCSSIGALFAKSQAEAPAVQTVDYVDLTRYAGKWHQIAFFPTRFQGKCTIDTTATYTIRSDGKVGVLNECKTLEGKSKSISGTARIEDRDSNAKLKVRFFWFVPAGDYWIIALDPEYRYAVVGEPDRKYLWILARSPSIKNSLYQDLVRKARDQGFDVSRLQLTSTLLPN